MILNRRSAMPSRWALVFLAVCCLLSLVITFSAGAQTSKRPPPSKPEESATIPDDPTLVPDDKESADNNVTFPVDI
jgi:hypothetical protein